MPISPPTMVPPSRSSEAVMVPPTLACTTMMAVNTIQ